MATGDILFDAPLTVRAVGQDSSGSSTWWAAFPEEPVGYGRIVLGNSTENGDPAQVNPFTLNHTYQVSLTEGSATVAGAIFQRTFMAWGVRIEQYVNPALTTSAFNGYTGQASWEATNAVDAPKDLGFVSFVADVPLKAGTHYTLACVPTT